MGTIFNKVGIESSSCTLLIEFQWIPDIVKSCEDMPLILVGCKGDLRSSGDEDIIPIEQVISLQIGQPPRSNQLIYQTCSYRAFLKESAHWSTLSVQRLLGKIWTTCSPPPQNTGPNPRWPQPISISFPVVAQGYVMPRRGVYLVEQDRARASRASQSENGASRGSR